MGRKKKKKKKNIFFYSDRKKTIRSLILLTMFFMVGAMTVRYVLNYVDFNEIMESIISSKEVSEKYPNLYNASRYFFRIYYPDNWNAEGGTNGFYMDKETGLICEIYPLKDTEGTPAPSATPDFGTVITPNPSSGAPSPSPTDRMYGKERDKTVTASFYYFDYTGTGYESYTPAPKQETQQELQNGEEAPKATPSTDRALLDSISNIVYSEFREKYTIGYTFDKLTTYDTSDIIFGTFSYKYRDAEDVSHSADVFVGVRSTNYVVIVYDGVSESRHNAYISNRDEFLSILEEFRFSVFDD